MTVSELMATFREQGDNWYMNRKQIYWTKISE